jgi:chromosome segregation ATPase
MGMKIAFVLFLMMCGMGWAGKMYYNDTQARMTILQQNNAKLEVAVQTQEEAMASLQADFAKANEELQKVNSEFAKTRQQNNVLSDKLARHDLGVLGNAKPGLVERTINRASAKAGRCFELLSGAELTEDEKNATSANAFNSECPWLWTSPTTP